MSRAYSAAELLRRAFDSRLGDVFTGMPARVEAYYPGDVPTVDVAPVIKRPIPTEEDDTAHEELPIIPNVPILFPRGKGGTAAITWPLDKGDHVWVMVSIWSFAEWRRTGNVSEPGDLRTHSLGNAYAIPGAAPDTEALAQSSTDAIVIEYATILLGKAAADFLAKANKVLDNLNKFKNAITSTVPVPNDGGAAIITSVSGVTFDDMATTKVKGE